MTSSAITKQYDDKDADCLIAAVFAADSQLCFDDLYHQYPTRIHYLIALLWHRALKYDMVREPLLRYCASYLRSTEPISTPNAEVISWCISNVVTADNIEYLLTSLLHPRLSGNDVATLVDIGFSKVIYFGRIIYKVAKYGPVDLMQSMIPVIRDRLTTRGINQILIYACNNSIEMCKMIWHDFGDIINVADFRTDNVRGHFLRCLLYINYDDAPYFRDISVSCLQWILQIAPLATIPTSGLHDIMKSMYEKCALDQFYILDAYFGDCHDCYDVLMSKICSRNHRCVIAAMTKWNMIDSSSNQSGDYLARIADNCINMSSGRSPIHNDTAGWVIDNYSQVIDAMRYIWSTINNPATVGYSIYLDVLKWLARALTVYYIMLPEADQIAIELAKASRLNNDVFCIYDGTDNHRYVFLIARNGVDVSTKKTAYPIPGTDYCYYSKRPDDNLLQLAQLHFAGNKKSARAIPQ